MSIIAAIFHRFVNPTADEGNVGETGPSEWNDSHDVTVAAPGASSFGDTVAEGAATSLARSDHRHSREANPITAHEAAADPHTGYRLESAPIAAADVAADVATQAELDAHHHNAAYEAIGAVATHAGLADPHTGYVKENDANWTDLTDSGETSLHSHAAAGGAPTDADYLVGTANAGLSGEIVVGTSPGGELGGTWGSPTVDATHSGSTHSAAQAAAEATAAGALSTHAGAADPHAGYRLESADHTHASTGAQAGKLAQANTHETPDTDAGPTSLHHTIGAGANQAAAGNHTHSGSAFSGAQVKKASSATQGIPNATATPITFDAEDYDVGGYHDNVTNNTRLTAPATGYYLISATVEFAANNTGNRQLIIRLDGTTNKYSTKWTAVIGTLPTNMTLAGVLYLTSGQYVEIMAAQTSTVTLNIGGGTDTEHCRASISLLGS